MPLELGWCNYSTDVAAAEATLDCIVARTQAADEGIAERFLIRKPFAVMKRRD